MSRKSNARNTPNRHEPPSLTTDRADAETWIKRQIKAAEDILASYASPPSQSSELESFRVTYEEWKSYTETLLKKLFNSDDVASEFRRSGSSSAVMGEAYSYWEKWEDLTARLKQKNANLIAIRNRLELYEPSSAAPSSMNVTADPSQVFVVHGHDGEVKQTVARLCEQLQLTPIILHEQANEGRTIIEKLEHHSNVAFAIVLLTPDDEGRAVGAPELRKRARQNVVLELGYFLSRLRRKNVAVLYVDGVELPSDMTGVLYIPYDSGESWKFRLAKEMRAAGLSVDVNLLVD